MSDQPVDINLQELRELIKLLRESNVTEFELRKADYRLRIKHGMAVEEMLSARAAVVPANGEPQSAPVSAPQELETEEVVSASPREDVYEVRSPIVGTLYRSANPGAPPFVEVGTPVRKGQVLCIVEAMKIMNEIESEVDGEVLSIHAANGQPLEFGELLFSIKLNA